MTSRERVECALRHEEPDRVPVDLGAMRSTGIMALAYHRWKAHLGLRGGETRVYDVIQQLAQPEQAILDYVEADVIDLGQAFLTEPEEWQDFPLPDGSAARIPAWIQLEPHDGGWIYRASDGTVIGRMPRGVIYLSQCYWPFAAGEEDLERLPEAMAKVIWAALPTAPWHRPTTPEYLSEVRQRARTLFETTDYAIMAPFGGNLLEWGQFLYGIENFLCELAAHPRKVERLLDRLVEVHLETLDRILPALDGYVQILQMGDDLGSQTGAQISPAMYRRFFKPRHAEIYRRIKEKSRMAVFLHSCGSIEELLPDLIDIGVDIINPVQTSAARMDPVHLKREYGKDLVFWGGGCDTQRVLPRGTPAEIEAHVRDRIRIFGPGGGFVFATVHNIMANVPPENIVALYEAVKRYRTYPLEEPPSSP